VEDVVVVVVVVVSAAAVVEAVVNTNLLRHFPSSTILDALSAVPAMLYWLYVVVCEHVLCIVLFNVVLSYKCSYTCVAVSPWELLLSKVPYLLRCKTR
jgi:uncharacterized BrkB/YihY/UPF0761 family membrane protein